MKIYTEGHLDRVVIEDLARLTGMGSVKVFPSATGEEDRYDGKDAATDSFLAEIKRGNDATLVLDLDDKKAEEHLTALSRKIKDRFTCALNGNIFIFETDHGKVSGRVLFAGLSFSEDLVKLKITRHQMEDYLLAILLDESTVFETLRKSNQFDEKGIDASKCLEKIEFMVDHLTKQNITISSKKVFDIFRAIVGFHAAPATLAQRLLEQTPDDRKTVIFKDLMQNLTP